MQLYRDVSYPYLRFLFSLFDSNTLDIICRLAFGIPLADCGAQGAAFAAAFDQAQDIIAQRFWKPFWKVCALLATIVLHCIPLLSSACFLSLVLPCCMKDIIFVSH